MRPTSRRLVLPAALVVALAACGTSFQVLPPGAREWIIPVDNQTNRPVVVAVAEDGPTMGKLVGSARPGLIPPGATIDVVFVVPAGSGWAIFVDPGPQRGPLILPGDVPPDASGRLPLSIAVTQEGPGVTAPGAPGWFGE